MLGRGVWCLLFLLACGENGAEPAATQAPASTPAVNAAAELAAGLPAERMVIREASLRLRSEDPRRTADAAAKIAGAAGGFVLNSDLRTVGGQVGEIELQLRVPAAALDATLKQLRGLGGVLLENVKGQDVSEEFVDVSARLRAQRTLETRLLALLQGSAQLKDALAVEQELARVRGEIELREGRIRYLQERSRMASIELVAEAPEQPLVAATQSLGSRFHNALRRSYEVAISVIEMLIVTLGFVLPFAPVGLAVTLVTKRLRRRRSARLQAAA